MTPGRKPGGGRDDDLGDFEFAIVVCILMTMFLIMCAIPSCRSLMLA